MFGEFISISAIPAPSGIQLQCSGILHIQSCSGTSAIRKFVKCMKVCWLTVSWFMFASICKWMKWRYLGQWSWVMDSSRFITDSWSKRNIISQEIFSQTKFYIFLWSSTAQIRTLKYKGFICLALFRMNSDTRYSRQVQKSDLMPFTVNGPMAEWAITTETHKRTRHWRPNCSWWNRNCPIHETLALVSMIQLLTAY